MKSIHAWIALLLLFGACSPPPSEQGDSQEHDTSSTNRIAIPPMVRSNLGITFATVEKRNVANTLRIPGAFETLPSAEIEYYSAVSGTVVFKVQQYQKVQAGDVLYTLDSTEWRDLQKTIANTINTIRANYQTLQSINKQLGAIKEHQQMQQELVDIWRTRIDSLKTLVDAGAGKAAELAEAHSKHAEARTTLAHMHENEIQLEKQKATLEERLANDSSTTPLLVKQAIPEMEVYDHAHDLLLSTAASLLGIAEEKLMKPVSPDNKVPVWRHTDMIAVRASRAGIVSSLNVSNGSWVSSHQLILATLDPEKTRFRAVGLQSDLNRLSDGLPVSIIPKSIDEKYHGEAATGELQVGLEADPIQRTIDLIVMPFSTPAWARPGVSAIAEINLSPDTEKELAIPQSSLVRDGVETFFFLRDPDDPDQVIRTPADLGKSDGEWVEVLSEVIEGDEVVLQGAYELNLTSSGAPQEGGHFHADGTWHAGEGE